jgi:hypothetical protein
MCFRHFPDQSPGSQQAQFAGDRRCLAAKCLGRRLRDKLANLINVKGPLGRAQGQYFLLVSPSTNAGPLRIYSQQVNLCASLVVEVAPAPIPAGIFRCPSVRGVLSPSKTVGCWPPGPVRWRPRPPLMPQRPRRRARPSQPLPPQHPPSAHPPRVALQRTEIRPTMRLSMPRRSRRHTARHPPRELLRTITARRTTATRRTTTRRTPTITIRRRHRQL